MSIRSLPSFVPRRRVRRPALPSGDGVAGISRQSSVLTVIPHYRCEEWLGDCLESILAQTRPPQGVVVVDDASGNPPTGIVSQFASVTLLSTTDNVGPYRIVQQVIDETRFDAYMFQDADDWSAPERLELELQTAERTGAELIGSYYCMVHCNDLDCRVRYFPTDVNEALSRRPTWHALQHPTSVISRALVVRLGGFATGMRFSGDTEILRRAAHVTRVVNVPKVLYFRRDRDGSLTTAADTGLQSPERIRIRELLADRARQNAAAVREGRQPDLAPFATADPVGLTHVSGPTLGSIGRLARRRHIARGSRVVVRA